LIGLKLKSRKYLITMVALITFLATSFGGLLLTPGASAATSDTGEVKAFVTRFYEECLDRQPDTTGLNYWVNLLVTRQKTGADVAQGFIYSNEFQAKNVSDDKYLDVLYQAFFNRQADSTGLAYWQDNLDDGVSRLNVLAGFVNSNEFGGLCADYGITAGSIKTTTTYSSSSSSSSSSSTPTGNTSAPAGSYNVTSYGATGNGSTDDTSAIQKAVNAAAAAGGGTVYVPAGTYIISPSTQVVMKSNTKLNLASGATLKAKSSSGSFTTVILINNVSNVSVTGGKIVGDRTSGATGSENKGITVLGSNNVTISGVAVSNFRGDGIYVGAGWSGGQNYCGNMVINNFTIDNCSRQGITVISAKNLTIKDGVITNISGTSPQNGIDLEPNYSTESLYNVLIENIVTKNCGNVGILVALPNVKGTASNPISITIKNLQNYNSGDGRDYFFWQYYPSSTCKITVI